MRLAFYDSNTDPTPTSVDASWSEIADLLCSHEVTDCVPCVGKNCPAKFGKAWSPVFIEGQRANEHVRAVTLAVLDLDHLDDAMMLAVAEAIEGFEYVFHSTHTANCYRLVMPLTRDVLAPEWRTFLRAAVSELGLPIASKANGMKGTDPSCKDLSRLYFLPTCPKGTEPLAVRGEGASLDVDAILALAGSPVRAAAEPIAHDESDALPLDVDVGDLRSHLSAARRRKAGSTNPEDAARYATLGRILHGEPLAVPGERDNTINQAAAMMAWAFPRGTPADAALEVLRPSLTAMDIEPEGYPHWNDRATRSFNRAMERRLERDAKNAVDDAAIQNRMKKIAATPREPSHAAASADAETDAADDGAWKASLIMRADLTPKACGENVVLILSRCPETRGTFKFNEVEKTIEVHGGPFALVPPEVLDVAVCDWLTRFWGISLSDAEIGKRIMRVARMNSYDPLRDYLLGLKWDGKSRSADFLLNYFGASCTDDRGHDITEHVRRIGQRWLVSAVARALQPGCQVDTVLVLEGKQGLRKTSALRVLGDRWFCDTQLALGDKDSKMLAAANWIIELAELVSVRRTETNAQKAFLTTRRDKYRPPYGKNLIDALRRCVFVGTINPEEGGGYLTDRTGNRRYWPVYCNAVDIEGLTNDRDQLWAEAVHLYLAGEAWWLNESEQHVADGQADERVGENVTEARIAEWWYGLHPSKRPEAVTTHGIAESALLYPFERITRAVQTEIGTALRRLGFQAVRKTLHGRAAARAYEPTKAMRDAPQGGRPSHLRLIASAKPA